MGKINSALPTKEATQQPFSSFLKKKESRRNYSSLDVAVGYITNTDTVFWTTKVEGWKLQIITLYSSVRTLNTREYLRMKVLAVEES